MSPDPLLTAAQVAVRLQLSRATVAAMLRRGEMPRITLRQGRGPVRSRAIYRVRESDLEEWLDARLKKPVRP